LIWELGASDLPSEFSLITEDSVAGMVIAYRGIKTGFGLWGAGIGAAEAWARAGFAGDWSKASGHKLNLKCTPCPTVFKGGLLWRLAPPGPGRAEMSTGQSGMIDFFE